MFCVFGEAKASATIISATDISCAPPAFSTEHGVHRVESVTAYLENSEGLKSPSLTSYLDYDLTVSSLTPTSGFKSGGTAVTISGTGFKDYPWLSCRFGTTVYPVLAQFRTSSSIVCVSPPQDSIGGVVVEVSTNGLDWTQSGLQFVYKANAFISALNPLYGTTAGGTLVTITGKIWGMQCVYKISTYILYFNLFLTMCSILMCE